MSAILGKLATGDQLRIDVPRLVETRLLVQANSGGGKSWALRRLLEETHGKLQHLVLDPEGEFASLRERFDYVLAARSGGDTVADPRTARLLAERLLELGVSAVLDIYELKAHERVAFVKNFLEAVVDAPKKLWHPALVVVDEAHVYCPENGSAESGQALIDLATRGRKRGYCAVFATQRLSKLKKDAAAECNNKLIGRTGLDVDMERAGGELGFGRARYLELRDLPEGHFYAFGPALSRGVVSVHVGPVLTTHPQAGGRIAFTAPPPSAKVRGLLPKLADLPAEAEQRERTVQELKREIASLKGQLRARPTVEVPRAEVKRVEVPVLKDAQVKRLEVAAEKAASAAREVTATIRGAIPLPSGISRPQLCRGAPAPAVRRDLLPRPHSNGAGDLTGPEQRILDALAWLESIGQSPAEETAVAFLAGYTIGGGAFNNPRGSLRTKGLIVYGGNSDRLALTPEGRERASFPEEALTPEELQRRVLERLPRPEQKILRVLLQEYPRAVPNDELARAAGYEPGGGAFNNPRGKLRTLGLIDYASGEARARPVLFLEAR